MKNRCYSELRRLLTLEDRYQYLKIGGVVGMTSFGADRYLGQAFYTSGEWKSIRDKVIIRDNGCDLGLEDWPIKGDIIIHHMNPISVEEIITRQRHVIDPEFLVCVSLRSHNAIHFGDRSQLPQPYIARRPGDTCLWK